ncbi:hypothetical protein HX37_16640 [Salmonella enterica]|uniref:Uncharacterized protein n=1 Tax=Salmonella enterica TaxID=28901 RepID=A0A5U2FA51_SALER|nr:hypothetical protein [Salmonella enterica]EBH8037507.1 hypothetical protein [Salmonella bongori]ECG0831005.1 hypothetical protein [Salmonella enterica subsp. diarizonae]EAP3485597.1 hypothetical protein [Salmonella enterica]EBD6774068.1 hypothetical protein [Salmonella enterica]
MKRLTTVKEIKDAASKAIFHFQTGKIDKINLYKTGVELTLRFNEIVDEQKDLQEDNEAQEAADFLNVIKHMSTC